MNIIFREITEIEEKIYMTKNQIFIQCCSIPLIQHHLPEMTQQTLALLVNGDRALQF